MADELDIFKILKAELEKRQQRFEVGNGNDGVGIMRIVEIPRKPGLKEYVGWNVDWVVDKRPTDVVAWIEDRMPDSLPKAATLWTPFEEQGPTNVHLLKTNPEYKKVYDELRLEFEEKVGIEEKTLAYGNLLVNAGMDLIWDAVIGNAVTTFSNANAYIGVGDSTTAAAAAQTDLQASSNKLRKAMNATYPDQPSNASVRFQSDFGSSEANYSWGEVATFNASAAGTMLHRLVPSGTLGTKSSGATWTITVTITLS